MARIDSGSSSSATFAAAKQAAAAAAKQAAAAAAKQAAAAAAKKAAADAAKKKAAEASKRKDGFEAKKHLGKLDKNYEGGKSGDLGKLANGKGTSKLNKDGSTTTSLEQSKKGTTTKQDLTTSRNKYTGQTKLKFESTSKTQTSATNSRETKHKFDAQTDLLRRTTSTQSKEVTLKKGQTTTVDSRSTATDQYGNKKVTTGNSKAVEHGNTTKTDGHSTTKGAFNTKQTVHETKTEVKDGKLTTTTTSKDTKGTDFALSHSTGFADGKFTLKDSADWKKNSFNKETGKEKEWKLKDVPTPDGGFTQQKTTGVQGGLDKAQKVGDLLGAAGLKKEWKGAAWDTSKLKELEAEKVSFAGSKVGTVGSSSISVGANGVDAKFKREASAGLYAQHNDSIEGTHGKASYQAGAKLEAKATFDATGKLNANGLDVGLNAKVGVSAEASIKGAVESKPVKFAGAELKVGAEGTAKVVAEAEAHATGTVKVTRNPPTAIATGSVGASAVVKAEAEVKVSAGPFAVKATGYASAGAEAKASGTIGYQDGKLKIGGSLGAALGVGLGGSVNIEVDVKQIGEMAKHEAMAIGDQNHDGKLGLDDVAAGAKNLKNAAVNTVSNAAKTVRSWLPW